MLGQGHRCSVPSVRLALVVAAALSAVVVQAAATGTKGLLRPGTVRHGVRRQLAAGDAVRRVPAVRGLAPRSTGTPTTIFSDDFEGAFPGKWSLYDGGMGIDWAQTDYRSFEGTAGTHSLYGSGGGANGVAPPGPYPNDTYSWVIYGPFDLSDATSGQVIFQLWYQMESDYDEVYAGLSTDGNWFSGNSWTGDSAGWTECQLNLADYLGQKEVYFALVFSSDYSMNFEGAYADQVVCTANIVQRYELSGTLTDEGGLPLAGALVTALPGRHQVYTDENGCYAMRLEAGDYRVLPSKAGYTFTPTMRRVTLGPAEPPTPAAVGATAVCGTNINFTGVPSAADGVTRYFALLVGISDFDGTINDLEFCDDDATAMRDALVASGGWDPANITLLTDSAATKAAIQAALADLVSRMDGDDVFVFLYSSHGYNGPDLAPLDEEDGTDEYLCTYYLNEDANNIRDDELGAWFCGLPTSRYVVLLDTCYSGGSIRSLGRSFAAGLAEDLQHGGGTLGTRDLDDNATGVVLAACRDDQLSAEDPRLGHGVFTYFLLDGLAGPADANHDGWISAEECYAYVRPRAQAYNFWQTAEMFDGAGGELNFAPLPSVLRAMVPADGATAVSRTTKITMRFNQRVRQGSAEARFALLDAAGEPVAGAFNWLRPQETFTFTPATPLAAGARYTARLDWGVRTAAGPLLYRGATSVFTTNSAPLLTAMSPMGDGAAPDAPLDLVFDQLMRPATVLNALSINGTPASSLGTLAKVGGDLKHLAFTPTTPWTAGAAYAVRLSTVARNQDGVRLDRVYNWTFTVADASGALVVSAVASPTRSGPSAITVSLSAAAQVSGSICNVAGREVAVLPARDLDAGTSTLLWNGVSTSGTRVPSGIYLLRLRANSPGGASCACLVPLSR